MDFARAEKIASAVLYEGYVLYPYRPTSIKNRVRWTFGGLYPEKYVEDHGSTERSRMKTEVLVRGDADTAFEGSVRFLHLVARTLEQCDREGHYRSADVLVVGERVVRPWQEAVEVSFTLPRSCLSALVNQAETVSCVVPASDAFEVVSAMDKPIGRIVRRRHALQGSAAVSADRLSDDLFRLRIEVMNTTSLDEVTSDRDTSLLSSLVAAHTLLAVDRGRLVSMVDDDRDIARLLATCSNEGTWPVLVGHEGSRDMMLSAPIILPDYPEVAAESPGDLFDATEIDEILSLRILTMTDAEKEEMKSLDPRALALLERTEALRGDDFMRLHGTLRSSRGIDG